MEEKEPEGEWEVRNEFAIHMLNEDGKKKAAEIAGRFTSLLNELERVCGKEGREMSIVRTHLQDASFYAKRAMAQKTENQIAQ